MPQTAMAPAHSTNKVGDITLPEGWSWQEDDKGTALADGVADTTDTGADKGNYETESVIITITKAYVITHILKYGISRKQPVKRAIPEIPTVRIVVKNPPLATVKKAHTRKPATCVSKACRLDATNHVPREEPKRKQPAHRPARGDTYCTDCDKLLSTGKELAALGHDYKGDKAANNRGRHQNLHLHQMQQQLHREHCEAAGGKTHSQLYGKHYEGSNLCRGRGGKDGLLFLWRQLYREYSGNRTQLCIKSD